MLGHPRFEAIAALVATKTKHQCLARCRFLKGKLRQEAEEKNKGRERHKSNEGLLLGLEGDDSHEDGGRKEWGEGGGRRKGRTR